MTTLPARGEVWWCEMAEIGRRPVVVLSRDAVIPRHRRALVARCTTMVRGFVSEVGLEPGADPISRRCVVNRDSVQSVSVAVRVERLGRLADTRMGQICTALASRSSARTDAVSAEETHPEISQHCRHAVGNRPACPVR